MKAAGKLVVNATARHLLKRGREDMLQIFSGVHVGTGVLSLATVYVGMGALTRSTMRSIALILVNQQIDHRRMRKFRRASESAVSLVKHLQGGIDDFLNNLRREVPGFPGERF